MKKEKNSSLSLTALWKIFRNINSFANHVSFAIEGEAGKEAEIVPFRDYAWAWQRELLSEFENRRRVVVLKARQLGVSWLLCIYALYSCLKYDGYVVLITSRTEKEAKRLIRRILQLYSSLPEELKELYPLVRETQTEIEWANRSNIIAMTSTPASGRSFSASLFILDEFAFFKYAEENWAAMLGAAEKGSVIVVSTANGINNKFYQLYMEAKEQINGFYPVFLPYNFHPARDKEWWNQKKKEMPAHQLFSEYPRDDMEAFISSGDYYFSREYLELSASNTDPLDISSLQVVLFPRTLSSIAERVKVFQYPVSGTPYAIGVDSAISGGGDNAAIVVLNGLTGEQVLEFAAPIAYTDLIPLVLDIAEAYNPSLVVPERNQVGAVVTQSLVEAGCNVWHTGYWQQLFQKSWKKGRGDIKYGFTTTHATKPTLMGMLEVALRTKAIKIASKELLRELLAIQRKGTKIEAAAGERDDRVIALALAWLGVASLPHTQLLKQVTPIANYLSPQYFDKILEEKYYQLALTEHGFMNEITSAPR